MGIKLSWQEPSCISFTRLVCFHVVHQESFVQDNNHIKLFVSKIWSCEFKSKDASYQVSLHLLFKLPWSHVGAIWQCLQCLQSMPMFPFIIITYTYIYNIYVLYVYMYVCICIY